MSANLSAVFYLLNTHLGDGDKAYALSTYVKDYLWRTKPTDKNSIMENTAGVKQDVLIARRIIDRCNTLIDTDVLTKKDGHPLKVTIGEEILEKADLGDPSKMS